MEIIDILAFVSSDNCESEITEYLEKGKST